MNFIYKTIIFIFLILFKGSKITNFQFLERFSRKLHMKIMFVSFVFLVGATFATSVKIPDGPQGPSGAILKVLQN